MPELLTNEEAQIAASQGWALHRLFDLDKQRAIAAILPHPVPESGDFTQAQNRVVLLAKMNDIVAIRALRLVVQSYTPKTKAKKP